VQAEQIAGQSNAFCSRHLLGLLEGFLSHAWGAWRIEYSLHHADDLGLIMDKTIKLEWHKVANTRTRCLRITQVALHLLCLGRPCLKHVPSRTWLVTQSQWILTR
jgi:hypothetical protein